MFKPADLFDLSQTEHAALFEGCEFAWDALKRLKEYVETNVRPGLRNSCEGVAFIGKNVFIGEGTVVEDGVMIKGPAIIGRNAIIYPLANWRGVLAADSIAKSASSIEVVARH